MIRIVRRCACLSRSDRRLLFEALFAVAAARFRLWFRPFARVRQQLLVELGSPADGFNARDPRSTDWEVERIAWAIAAAARHFPAASCLTQAIGARTMLSRRGIDSEVHLGVKQGARGELLAHAWLEHRGRIVTGGLGGKGLLSTFAELKLPD